VVHEARAALSTWLADIGLRLSPGKARVVHTLDGPEDTPPGFDFLGLQIRQHRVGKAHAAKDTHGRPLGFKTLVQPSKAAQVRHQRAVRRTFRRHTASAQAALIAHLNPLIRGWASYFSRHASSRTFKRMDLYLWRQLVTWANRRHPTKSSAWKRRRYWTSDWKFQDKTGAVLHKHSEVKITRHVKVGGPASPYDGTWAYWSRRMVTVADVPTRVGKLLRRQQGRCAFCRLYFRDSDLLEVDHVVRGHGKVAIGGQAGPRWWPVVSPLVATRSPRPHG
jgi:RNA-directed DNA polymerase